MTLPVLPQSIDLLPPSLPGLVLASAAGAGAFRVDGQRVRVAGAQRSASLTLEVDGRVVVGALDPGLGAAVNVIACPGLVRRELAGTAGIRLETILAAPTLPLIVLQWGAPDSGGPTEVSFEVPGAPAEVEVDAAGSTVQAALAAEHVVAVGFVRPAGASDGLRFDLAATPSGGTRVRASGFTGEPLTCVVASGTHAEVRAACAASAHLDGHARRAAASPVPDGLRVETGVAEIDDGLAWAIARVHAAVNRIPDTNLGPEHRLLAGLAASAANDIDGMARLLERGRSPWDTIHGLLAAGNALTTGRSGPAARTARAWNERDAAAPEDPLGVSRLAHLRLADALRHGAPDALVAALRQRATPPERATATALPMAGASSAEVARGTSLPMAGQPAPAAAAWGPWLNSVLAGNPEGRVPASSHTDVESIRSACRAFRTDPDDAWASWRRVLASGITDGRLASWGAQRDVTAENSADGADVLAAELVLTFAHGLLGYAPDAPVGRIRLAPRLPVHVTSFTVTGLGLGDASLTLSYERIGAVHRFTIDPSFAAVPPLAVFEPEIPGTARSVRVDDAPAELDPRASENRTIVPVQIPIDGPRTIEIETGA